MNKLRWRILLIISLLIIFNVGCTEKPEHSNPFDPLNPGYPGIGSIAGAVRQDTGVLLVIRPITGAEVDVTQNGERKGSAVTTVADPNNGKNFSISNLNAGIYDLTASALGYKPRTIKGISVVAGQTTECFFELFKE